MADMKLLGYDIVLLDFVPENLIFIPDGRGGVVVANMDDKDWTEIEIDDMRGRALERFWLGVAGGGGVLGDVGVDPQEYHPKHQRGVRTRRRGNPGGAPMVGRGERVCVRSAGQPKRRKS